jgi:protein-disulfide isomerase
MPARLRLAAVAAMLALAGCNDASSAADAGSTAAAKTGPASPIPAGTNWATYAVATPEGGFRLGNPNARVKLIEFASLTCPHCKDFHAAAFETIRGKYVASGNVSYEYRSFVLNGPDFAATVLARCQGARPFFGLLNAFYQDQTSWIEPFTRMTPADQQRLQGLPEDKQIAALAEIGGLDAYVRARGIPRARFDQCLADKAGVKAVTDLRTQATDTWKLTGTPGFILNGTVQKDVYDWAGLEARIQQALR